MYGCCIFSRVGWYLMRLMHGYTFGTLLLYRICILLFSFWDYMFDAIICLGENKDYYN